MIAILISKTSNVKKNYETKNNECLKHVDTRGGKHDELKSSPFLVDY